MRGDGDRRRGRLRGSTQDELEFHLEMRARELEGEGLTPAEARAEAGRRFGDAGWIRGEIERIHHRSARRRGAAELLAQTGQDIAVGARRLVRAPAFSVMAVVILALGIGANSAIFTVLNAVVLRPLPYPEPDRLAQVWESAPDRGWDLFAVSELNYLDFRAGQQSFDVLAAATGSSYNLTGGDEPERISGARVSREFFDALGTPPLLGRAFSADEDAIATDVRVVVLGHDLWQRHFGRREDVLGETLVLDDVAHTVIGVARRGHLYYDRVDVFVPLRPGTNEFRSDHRLEVFGRLRDGVTVHQAEADLDAIAAALAERYPDSNAGFDTRVNELYDGIVPAELRSALYVLLGAVGLVLLIACVNLSSLLLARATARRREIAIYSALGASRARVMRQLLAEASLLALVGAGVGLIVAQRGVVWFRALDADRLPRFETLSVDGTVLLFTLAIALLTGIVAGLFPAWQATGTDPHRSLKEGARQASEGPRARRARHVLLGAEVALSIVLLAGAALLIRSLWRVQAVDPGLDADNVLTLGLSMPVTSEDDWARLPAQFRRIIAQIEALPGVVSAATISGLPFGDGNTSMDYLVEGVDHGDTIPSASWRLASPQYLETMRIPLLRGRWFTDGDGLEAREWAVISESMAEQNWPGEDPIGRRFHGWRDPERIKTVIGVVADVRERDLESDASHIVYMPHLQMTWWPSMYVVVRTAGDPVASAPSVREAIARVVPDRPVSSVRSLRSVLDDTLGPRRFNTLLLMSFAAVALALAAAGVYGVVAYSVAARTAEIGIRMAMGARARGVLALMIGQAMRVVLVGIGAGLVAAFALTRLLTGMLYGVAPIDASSLGAAVGSLVLVALCACALPALRATRVDPATTLRDA